MVSCLFLVAGWSVFVGGLRYRVLKVHTGVVAMLLFVTTFLMRPVAVLFNNDLANYDLFGMLTAEPSYGIWVGVAGGVLTIVGCVGCILKKEPRYSDGMEYGMEP